MNRQRLMASLAISVMLCQYTSPSLAEMAERITITKTYAGNSATGTVILRQVQSSGASPHVKLASSRAWLALAQQRLVAQDWRRTITCARSGLKELGRNYASMTVNDDSTLKLSAADDRLKKGFPRDAATIMVDILDLRTRLYVELYANEIAE